MNTMLDEMISFARMNKCSDLHLQVGGAPIIRKNGKLMEYPGNINDTQTMEMILSMVDDEMMERMKQGKDLDFTYVTAGNNRQRVNVYRQQGKLCAALRIINDEILTLDQLQMPEVFKKLAMEPRGLVLVTGPTGSGKSTTLAAVIDYVNEHKDCHILTIEDPIEYVYQSKKAMIHQREIEADVDSFDTALRSALREDPDVILVGEMRDYETISAVITLAETGHLVFSTLHTIGAAKTIDRIIDVFPQHKQAQIRMQLAGILKAVVTQQLLPTMDGTGRCAALEIMTCTDAVSAMIRESKVHQINSLIQTGMKEGMQTLNFSLAQLVRSGKVDKETAKKYSDDPNELMQYLM
ncbi:type IV pilus twitching motility protein PilT [[Eubacterium] hominis]|uniref:type IV pilus twitching motility protein PilT n=1 Tax=[Eubacterium] hominis TaxID=2764325 RepID=UPI003A4E0551